MVVNFMAIISKPDVAWILRRGVSFMFPLTLRVWVNLLFSISSLVVL